MEDFMRLPVRSGAYALMVAGLVFTACAKLPEDYPTPTPIPTPAESNKPTYTVQRGTIDQVVKALGRGAANQKDITHFRQPGRLYKMYVDTDTKVKQGDLLAELDTGTLKDQVNIARVTSEISALKVDQAMGKDGSGNPPAAVTTATGAVAKAEADYAQAQDALTKLLTGSTTSDRDAARAAISSAQS